MGTCIDNQQQHYLWKWKWHQVFPFREVTPEDYSTIMVVATRYDLLMIHGNIEKNAFTIQ